MKISHLLLKIAFIVSNGLEVEMPKAYANSEGKWNTCQGGRREFAHKTTHILKLSMEKLLYYKGISKRVFIA